MAKKMMEVSRFSVCSRATPNDIISQVRGYTMPDSGEFYLAAPRFGHYDRKSESYKYLVIKAKTDMRMKGTRGMFVGRGGTRPIIDYWGNIKGDYFVDAWALTIWPDGNISGLDI